MPPAPSRPCRVKSPIRTGSPACSAFTRLPLYGGRPGRDIAPDGTYRLASVLPPVSGAVSFTWRQRGLNVGVIAVVILTGDMTTPDIPLLDISVWRDGDANQRARLAARMDQALRQSGFLLIENHGVPASLRERIRAEASGFFAPPGGPKS